MEYSDIDFSIARDNWNNRKPIGIGKFGDTYHAVFRGVDVAVKELRKDMQYDPRLNEFRDEYNTLSRLRHPNIIELYGICTDRAIDISAPELRESFYCLVMEYASNGSLHDLIHPKQNTNDELDIKLIKKMLKQIARALVYLHSNSPPMIHRDLKPASVVFDSESNAKLTDFGLAKIVPMGARAPDSTVKGTIRYMAPEQVNKIVTTKSDIYSFGLILWELFTRKYPYSDVESDAEITTHKNNKNYKFKFPPGVPLALKELGKMCLKHNPNFRPTAVVVLYELEKNEDGTFSFYD